MKKNADLGAQLVKSLTFEVEATPQDNAIEIKNTENMTPLNVKVRVRKKNDGTSFVRKGVIAVPRIDLPDTPIERLRLASSDHTIMSFNMLMEADLEKTRAKKTKRSFFGICLGVQGDDDTDDFQYMPSASSLEKDSRSDTGVVKLKHVRPTVRSVVTETSSSFTSRKKDKFFGKCKPGGCLDPPFGEDKYAYQPQPKSYKAPIDDGHELDLKEPADKIFLKKKTVEVTDSKVKTESDGNVDKSILNLYQGEAKPEAEENESEFIITYPPGLSSSGLLMADDRNEKNVVRRTSGARHSRKSFNEFSAEYFSPPRTPRDSKDSQRDKGKSFTKEILSPNQATAKSISPAGHLQDLEKYDSKYNIISGTEIFPQKTALAQSSDGITSELLNGLERKPDRNTLDSGATALAGVGLATTGLVGLGIALGTKKDIDKSEEVNTNGTLTDNLTQKSIPETSSAQDLTPEAGTIAGLAEVGDATMEIVGLEGLGTKEDIDKLTDHEGKTLQILEGTSTRNPMDDDMDTNTNRGLLSTKSAIITATDDDDGINTIIPSQEHVDYGDTERDLVFHGVDLVEGSERRISQLGNTFLNRPIHDETYKDLVPTGTPTTEDSERGRSRTERQSNVEGVVEDDSTIGMEVIGDSERGLTPTGQSIHDSADRRLLSGRRTSDSEGKLPYTERAINETNDDSFAPIGITMTDRSEESSQLKERETFEGAQNYLGRGSEQGYPQSGSDLDQYTQEKHGAENMANGAVKMFSPKRRAMSAGSSAGMDPDLRSRENTVVGGSDKGILPIEIAEIPQLIETGMYEGAKELLPLGSENGYPLTGRELSQYNHGELGDRSMTDDFESTFSPTRRAMGADMDRVLRSGENTVVGGSDRGIPPMGISENNLGDTGLATTSLERTTMGGNDHDTSREVYEKFDRDFSPSEFGKNGKDQDISTNKDVNRCYTSASELSGGNPSGANIPTLTKYRDKYGKIIKDFERDNIADNGSHKGKTTVAGIGMEPTDDVLEQADKIIGNFGNKDGRRGSRESIFLNFAFQAYQDDNQTAIKTLDSSKDQDPSKVVLVKSLIRSHEKSGISVPIDSKHMMKIAISSVPLIHHRKSKIPKPISKFDSGKSDNSNSTISFKEIGNDPHAALSMVFHQELVPLESIIRSLKDDIDSLAAQQMMLTDRLGTQRLTDIYGNQRLTDRSQRLRPVFTRKCGCLKRVSIMRPE